MPEAGVLGGAYVVFDAGVYAVTGVGALDGQAVRAVGAGVGDERRVPVAAQVSNRVACSWSNSLRRRTMTRIVFGRFRPVSRSRSRSVISVT
ncbi:hypothetical protein [Micromonospora sp. WMMD710]|uniref:hypothetical protein n=1 Tax=Micromonospora sp. WMMD710 TaxID=3016085 RepID=UPI0024167C6F|nr:hypothetical protein [Micromonospora sp. WMMD710]MDG4760809.1 hypothetical protein [Micromonospora sp. WMMD710]